MTRYYYRPWKDDSLISALHFMRCRIVRNEEPGLDHVDALLRQMGVDPESLPIPDKRPKHFKRGELRRAILDALRDGPQTGAQLAERVRGDLDARAAFKRTYQALNRMKAVGLVMSECGRWKRA